jgi:hypothetical protein
MDHLETSNSPWGSFGRELAVELRQALKPLQDRIARLEAALEQKSPIKYMGVHKIGAIYSEGSLVTRDGSLFHANKTTRELPGDGNQDWTLAVKRGRDGKDSNGG